MTCYTLFYICFLQSHIFVENLKSEPFAVLLSSSKKISEADKYYWSYCTSLNW